MRFFTSVPLSSNDRIEVGRFIKTVMPTAKEKTETHSCVMEGRVDGRSCYIGVFFNAYI